MTDFFNFPWWVVLINSIIIIAIVFFQKRNPISSMAWILCLTLFPVIGGMLFLVFGVAVESYAKYSYRKKQEINENAVLDKQREIAKEQGNDSQNFTGMIKYFLNSGCVY